MKHKIRHTGSNNTRLCGGKRCYPHKHEAEQVKSEQELLVRDLELSIYRCLDCHEWHLTRSKDSEASVTS